MKKLIFLSVSFTLLCAHEDDFFMHKKAKPQPAALENNDQEDDDIDGQVVLANVANMLHSIGTISGAADSQGNYNPAVLGPSIVNICLSVANIIAQAFKSIPHEHGITQEQLEEYFKNLSQETKQDLIKLVVIYADYYRHKDYYDQTINQNLIG